MEEDTLNEIVEPAFGAELLSEVTPVKKKAKKKAAKKKAAKKKVQPKPEPLIEGQVIGGRFRERKLHTSQGKLAVFASHRDAIIASKRYGGRAFQDGSGFIVKQ